MQGASPGAKVWLEANGGIESGNVWRPIVNEAGRLMGIVSHDSFTPRPHLALPIWAWRQIKAAQGAKRAA